MSNPEFVHLHVHTAYSLLDGAIRVKDLLAQAQAYGMPAVAITDHGSLFGVLDFYQKAKAAGIKPLLGCELYVAPGSRQEKTGKGDNRHLVVLAENLEGYHNLIRLVTRAHQEGFYYRPRVDKELLQELNGGLIALSSCLHGVVAPATPQRRPRGAPRPAPGSTPRSFRAGSTWRSRPTTCRSSSRSTRPCWNWGPAGVCPWWPPTTSTI